ncbi:hypothetical protein [Fischerella sp. JS2]|uniref:hypothetical protein n=1 Tax=Fischerella sp. JS2 TaxID=2597771 RepID=UPI0028E46666|nr:hypothetical protein [Fischerella sp. JS2]
MSNFINSWRTEHQSSTTVEDSETITEISLTLGTAWGNAIVKEFGWQWVCVEYEEQDFYAVVAPNRAYGCLPFNDVNSLLTNPQADSCAVLLFNMIKANNLPFAAANQYQMLRFGARRSNIEISEDEMNEMISDIVQEVNQQNG